MEKIAYGGWPNCVRLANDALELIVTTDVGPRIIRCALRGEENLFAEMRDDRGKTGGSEWRIYGGHRLWHAPEAKPRTYSPDNGPVQVEERQGWLRLTQPTEPDTGIQKRIDLRLRGNQAAAEVIHRLRNNGPWPVTLAAWALSVMRQGSVAVAPWPTRATPDNLLPNRALVLWPYSSTADPRLILGRKYIRLSQDPHARQPIKFGLTAYDGWGAALVRDQVFLKLFRYQENAPYPDYGSGLECYTNADFLELETVGPLTTLEPGQELQHVEHWFVFRGGRAEDEAAIDRTLLPLVERARELLRAQP